MNSELKTVLLVDDEPANIQIVNSILKDIYKTRIATSGAKALELANQDPAPDLILLDVLMPGMNGYEVCSHLKSADRTRDIPVIFLTVRQKLMMKRRASMSVLSTTSTNRSHLRLCKPAY